MSPDLLYRWVTVRWWEHDRNTCITSALWVCTKYNRVLSVRKLQESGGHKHTHKMFKNINIH